MEEEGRWDVEPWVAVTIGPGGGATDMEEEGRWEVEPWVTVTIGPGGGGTGCPMETANT
jgi:hypothetical protein